MFKYLHNGTYHSDTSSAYMTALGLDEKVKESILDQKEYEESQPSPELILFKIQRQRLIDNAVVEISTCKKFDADELSITRMANALIKHWQLAESDIIPWSTADVPTGVMVDCTKAEIIEAHSLATDHFATAWNID